MPCERGYFMFYNKQLKNRKFSYEPQYYDPEKEKREHRGIHFKRLHARQSAKHRSFFWLLTLLGIVAYFIYHFSTISK